MDVRLADRDRDHRDAEIDTQSRIVNGIENANATVTVIKDVIAIRSVIARGTESDLVDVMVMATPVGGAMKRTSRGHRDVKAPEQQMI